MALISTVCMLPALSLKCTRDESKNWHYSGLNGKEQRLGKFGDHNRNLVIWKPRFSVELSKTNFNSIQFSSIQ